MPTWFERLTGFPERGYVATQARLKVSGETLRSEVNGASWAIGRLETPSLAELRAQVAAFQDAMPSRSGALKLTNLVADAHALHASTDVEGALIQVASQFNLLEMVHPNVSPEDGVTCYENDHTQGPACAMAAGPATFYRNYLVPVAGGTGQTTTRQINTLHDLLQALPGGRHVEMRNGYTLAQDSTMAVLHHALINAEPTELDAWRSLLRIGVHWNVEVTAQGPGKGQRLTQAFCSAVPVSYNRTQHPEWWEPFARLVLEAAYEATLLAGVLNAANGGSNRVYLTLLGGGAFGNNRRWILDAMRRALDLTKAHPLDVTVVSFSGINDDLKLLAESFVGAT